MAPRLETCGSYVTSTLQLAQGQWNQVLGTYDGSKLRLYINGSESNSKAVTGVCNASAAPSIGGDTAGNKLAGMLDEVVLYPSVLSAERVADLFDYQNGWVEDRASQSIVVDNDDPTAEVLLPSAVTYLPLQDTQVALAAADGTSGVASVALCQAGACLGPAAHCAEEQGIWCAPFKPTAEGSYSLTAQAVDGVGRTGPQSAARTVRVDNTPPKLVLNTTTGQRLDATRDPVDATGWRISLSGTAADPNYGSGVPADGVRVSVYNASGGLAGPERQVATLSPNGTWSLDYPLSESRPGGCYSIVVEASDALADTPGLTAARDRAAPDGGYPQRRDQFLGPLCATRAGMAERAHDDLGHGKAWRRGHLPPGPGQAQLDYGRRRHGRCPEPGVQRARLSRNVHPIQPDGRPAGRGADLFVGR